MPQFDPQLYEALFPLLTDADTGQMWDPDTWLEEYGMYVTPFDPTETQILAEEQALSTEQAITDIAGSIYDVEKGLGRTGFAGSYMGSRYGDVLGKTAADLSLSSMKGLEAYKDLFREYKSDLYGDLSNLAQSGAFDFDALQDSIDIGLLSEEETAEWLGALEPEYVPRDASGNCPCIDGSWSAACCDYEDEYTDWDAQQFFSGQESPEFQMYLSGELDFADLPTGLQYSMCSDETSPYYGQVTQTVCEEFMYGGWDEETGEEIPGGDVDPDPEENWDWGYGGISP